MIVFFSRGVAQPPTRLYVFCIYVYRHMFEITNYFGYAQNPVKCKFAGSDLVFLY